MKERLSNLLTIKSLVTLAMTLVFCILALRGVLSGQEFLTVFTTVIAFYFGTQTMRGAAAEASKDKDKAAQNGEAVGTINERAVPTGETVDNATYAQMHPSDAVEECS